MPGGRLTLSELAGSRQSPKPIERVPFQLYPPNGKMTRSDLDRPSHNLVICPNKLERHEPPSPKKMSPASATSAANGGLPRPGTDSPSGGPLWAASPCRKKP